MHAYVATEWLLVAPAYLWEHYLGLVPGFLLEAGGSSFALGVGLALVALQVHGGGGEVRGERLQGVQGVQAGGTA